MTMTLTLNLTLTVTIDHHCQHCHRRRHHHHHHNHHHLHVHRRHVHRHQHHGFRRHHDQCYPCVAVLLLSRSSNGWRKEGRRREDEGGEEEEDAQASIHSIHPTLPFFSGTCANIVSNCPWPAVICTVCAACALLYGTFYILCWKLAQSSLSVRISGGCARFECSC